MQYGKDGDSAKTAEFMRDLALRNKRAEGPASTGFCHNCGEPVHDERRWCDIDCREDWEKRNQRG